MLGVINGCLGFLFFTEGIDKLFRVTDVGQIGVDPDDALAVFLDRGPMGLPRQAVGVGVVAQGESVGVLDFC